MDKLHYDFANFRQHLAQPSELWGATATHGTALLPANIFYFISFFFAVTAIAIRFICAIVRCLGLSSDRYVFFWHLPAFSIILRVINTNINTKYSIKSSCSLEMPRLAEATKERTAPIFILHWVQPPFLPLADVCGEWPAPGPHGSFFLFFLFFLFRYPSYVWPINRRHFY